MTGVALVGMAGSVESWREVVRVIAIPWAEQAFEIGLLRRGAQESGIFCQRSLCM